MNKLKKNPELTNQENDLMWNWRDWYVAVIKATRSPILKAQWDLIQPLNMFARPNTELRRSLFSCKVNFSVILIFIFIFFKIKVPLKEMSDITENYILHKNILERTFFASAKHHNRF